MFKPVGKKLLGRHALGGDFAGLFLPKKLEKKGIKQNMKTLQGANPVHHRGRAP